MIRFVDLETGNTFDGSTPYIFWMPGEQSTNIIYSLPICFITDKRDVNISIENNDIFSLVDPDKLLNTRLDKIYGFEYLNIQTVKCFDLVSSGVKYEGSCYVHIIYIIASSTQQGECICTFKIDDEEYTVGADFYGENESLYINLANNSVEIPEVVQKAIYDVNVHEEKRDNITLNRKWKELLSNLWEVISNKGSYKSLYNSLKWFEYGDKVKLYEAWKDIDNNKYFLQDVHQLLNDKFAQTLNGYAKTTYLSLQYALETSIKNNGKIIYDEEKNPKLEYVVSKWSTQDLALKLCMLGNFYETYFLPIHLDLLHATITDVVYSNTFKVVQGTLFEREDYVYNCDDITCNINNGDVFRLGKVSCQVGPETLFGLSYEEFQQYPVMIGVQNSSVSKLTTNDDWKMFASQMYDDIGSVVDFNIQIPLHNEDKIKREVLVYKTFIKDHWENRTVVDYKILDGNINFQLFCPIEGEYEVKLQFDSMGGKTFTKHVRFNVIDTQHVSLNVYKIYNKKSTINLLLGSENNLNDYIFSGREKISNETYIQYIPAKIANPEKNDKDWKGVCLNHMIIIDENILNSYFNNDDWLILNRFYFLIRKKLPTNYIICVSREFGFDTNKYEFNATYNKIKSFAYRDEYIFVREFHELVPIDIEKLDRKEHINFYTVTDEDALCVIPELAYGKVIDSYDWEFINVSNPRMKPIKMKYVKEPFVADTQSHEPLKPGYYTIKFNYRLTHENKINTITLDSAFKKV